MSRLTQISIAIFFVLTTLMGSVGLSLHKMACYQSGKITLTLDQFFCCAADSQELPANTVAAVCCDFDVLEFKVSAFEHFEYEPIFAADIPESPIFTFALSGAQSAPLLYEKFIPPLPQNQRLALFGAYLI